MTHVNWHATSFLTLLALAHHFLDLCLDLTRSLLPGKHELEALEVRELGLGRLGSNLLCPCCLPPLPEGVIFLESFLQSLLPRTSEDAGRHRVCQRDALDGDLLPLDSSGRTIDDHPVETDNVNDGGHLALIWPIIDVDKAARLHKTLEELGHAELQE